MKEFRGGQAGVAVALAIALSACGSRAPAKSTAVTRPTVVAEFLAEVDPKAGTVTVTPLPASPDAAALTYWSALTEINVVQNGIWDDAAEGTVEMRTAATRTYAGGCNGSDRFEADITIHSGFLATRLLRPYVEMVDITPTGFRSCMSDPAPRSDAGELALSEANGGLFAYPDIDVHGYGTAIWSFTVASTGSFIFHGRLVAQTQEATPPTTTASPAGGAGAQDTQPITLSCDDAGGTGCADTYFSVDGAATVAYTSPIRQAGVFDLCFQSADVAGNLEAAHCGHYVMAAPAVAAVYDTGLHVPVCPGYPWSCGTGTLLTGVGTQGPEPHQPNTLDGCADRLGAGTTPSLDGITLETGGGVPLAPGVTVTLTANVFAVEVSDYLSVYYATTTTSPTWTLINSAPAPGLGSGTVQIPFTLADNAVAIRARFGDTTIDGIRANGCSLNDPGDTDDLVFTPFAQRVGAAAPAVAIASPAASAVVSRQQLVRVTAADPSIVQVDLYTYDTLHPTPVLRGTDTSPPWIFAWNTNDNVGATTLFAIATDNNPDPLAVNTVASSNVAVDVWDYSAPVVLHGIPAQDDAFSKAASPTITVEIDATDGVNLVREVAFYLDGAIVATPTTPDRNNTWQAILDTSTLSNGTHTVWARARDWSDNYAKTPRVTFTVGD